jgi:spermidine synthase
MAFCSMGYEQCLAFQLSSLTGLPRIWETWTIAIFVVSMGIGAQLFEKIKQPALQEIASVEFVLSIAGLAIPALNLIVALIYRVYVYENSLTDDSAFNYFLGLACLPGVAAIGFLSGLEMPYLLKDTALGQSPAKLLAVYYGGSLFGSMAFLGMKWMGLSIFPILTLLSAINLIVCAVILKQRNEPIPFQWFAPVAILATLMGTFGYSQIEQIYLKGFYYNRASLTQMDSKYLAQEPLGLVQLLRQSSELPQVQRIHTSYQIIDFVPKQADMEGTKSLYINGRFQISDNTAHEYHEPFAVAPASLINPPKTALILGGGDGALAHQLNQMNPSLKITLVELDQKIIDTASTLPFLTSVNGNIFQKKRVQVVIADAFNYLRHQKEQFDGIYIDVTYPFDFDSMRFYSAEFLRLVTKSLTPKGYVVAGMTGDLAQDQEMTRVVASTFRAVGLNQIYSFQGASDWFVTATRKEGAELDPTDLRAKVKWHRIDAPFEPGKVHSLLKPQYFNLRDPFH